MFPQRRTPVALHSSSTTFRLEGDTLTIRTDMKEERFPSE